MMAAQYLGEVSIGAAFPAILPLLVKIQADLNGRLAGLLKVSAAITIKPPTLVAAISAAVAVAAQLQASLSLGLPGVTLQVGAVAAIILEFNARLAVIVALLAQLGAAVHLYSVSGRADSIGPALSGILGAGPPGSLPSDACAGILLLGATATGISGLSGITGISF